MLELKVGDRVRSRGAASRVSNEARARFRHPGYVIDWDDGEQSEIWPGEERALEERLKLCPI